MNDYAIYILIWEFVAFIVCFALMYYALNAIDFSKIFKKNSTLQIKIILLLLSSTIAFSIACGFGEILQLITQL